MQPALYQGPKDQGKRPGWMDGWAGPLSSNSVIFPGWESGLQVGDEESTGAEGERGSVATGGCLSQEDHHDSLF